LALITTTSQLWAKEGKYFWEVTACLTTGSGTGITTTAFTDISARRRRRILHH
jgi:hypothetical protein